MIQHFLNASLNDKFTRAQWKYCSPEVEEEISRDIHMGDQKKILIVVHQFLNWDVKDINYFKKTRNSDIIKAMFFEFTTRQSNTCPILCLNPDVHFSERKCFPIFKVYQIFKAVDGNAANHLKNAKFVNQILENVARAEELNANAACELDMERVYPIYSLPHNIPGNDIKKKIVLTIDFSIMEDFDNESESVFYTGLNNLLDNINKNFTCMLVPQLKMKMDGKWIDFFQHQIDNAEIIIIVFSPSMLNILLEWKTMTDFCASNSALDYKLECLRFLWTTVKCCKKPTVGVVFDESLRKDADSLLPVVIYLPNDLKLLLGYLLHRLQNL